MSTIGLVVLLLLSPCKVRNTVQSALGVPTTGVSNKNVTTVHHKSCDLVEKINKEAVLVKSVSQNFPVAILNFMDEYIIHENINITFFNSSEHWQTQVPLVPYYILYKNFKVYLF